MWPPSSEQQTGKVLNHATKDAPSSGRDLQVPCLLRLFPFASAVHCRKVNEPEARNYPAVTGNSP